MATPWWAQVDQAYYDEPSPVGDAVNKRMRTVKAVLSDTRLADEPQIAGAFMSAGVPISMAMRADAEYRQVKAAKREQMLGKAGMGNAQEQADLAALEAKRRQEGESDFWSRAGDFAGGIGDGIKDGFVGALHGLNAAFSPVTVPVAAARANADTSDESEPRDPVTWLLGEGAGLIAGTQSLSADQQADMRRSGYNPDSFASRYAWYFDSMEAGQKAVADDDVKAFSQEFDPDKVKIVREIITSDYLNDKNPAALSPAAQDFITKLQSDAADPRDRELFGRMDSSSTLMAGSYFANAFGLDRGSVESLAVSAVGDLAIYWYVDPIAGVGSGVRALRNARYGFDAGKIGAADAKLMQLSKPGDVNSAPARGASSAFSQLMDQVDEVYTLQRSNDPAKMARAAQITNRLALRTPEAMGHFDALMAMRSGRVSGIRVRNYDELRIDARQAGRQRNRKVNPLIYRDVEAGQEGIPVWRFRDDDGNLLSQADQNAAKANVVNRMSEFIWSEAWNTGRPLHRGKALLPGQVSLNRRVRDAVAPVRDALIRADQSVFKAFNTRTGVVKFNGQFDRADEMLLGDTAGAWIAQNYTRKWGRTFEKGAARFDRSFTGRRITWDTAEGLETYRRFVTQFMPRRLAYIAVNKWAMASPAERMAQWRQTAEAVEQAAGFRKDKLAGELTDYLTKGRVPRPAEKNRMGPLEAYSGIRADNTIKADGHELAAGIHSYQMADGITLPSLREIRQLQQKTGLLSAATGLFHTRAVNTLTSLWKVGKVANPANMLRQVIELVGLGALEQGAGAAAAGAKARRFVAKETVAGRLAVNDEARAANRLITKASGNDLDRLNKAFRAGDMGAYRAEMVNILNAAGVKGRHAEVLANLNEGVWFDDVARFSSGGRTALAMVAGLDMARRVRLRWMERTGVTKPRSSPWQSFLDEEIAGAYLAGALNDLGAAKDQYAMLGPDSVVDDLLAAADRGIGGAPARIPNSREWLGTHGDRGAQQWHNEFDSRVTDPVGQWVARAVALEARSPKGAIMKPGEIINADLASRGLMPAKFPPGVETAQQIAEYLIREAPDGARLRQNASRLQYTEDGKLVEGAVEIAEAQNRLAQVMIRDHSYHLGGVFDPATGTFTFDGALNDLLDKVALGQRATLEDFSKVPDKVRPKEISTSLYVPAVGKGDKRSIVNLAAKMYGFAVARPLDRLAVTPAFLANRNIAYRQMEPVFDELLRRGFDTDQAAALLEASASRYAVNATFRYTDEATEHTVFSELTDNFLMFQRASEDFIKRFMRVTAANPQILSRGYLLMEAGQHSGMIYPQTTTDDEGNEETHLVMTFPGSGVMAKAIQESGRALGWNDTDLILQPLYSSMSSQVRFVNPSLSNPLGFSTSPLIGMPMRIARSMFPESYNDITDVLARMEGGGERFFAEQNIVQSLMPTPLARLVPALTPEDADSQLASSIRNAFIHYGAAGLLPVEGASPDEIEEAHDAIRGMATNQLIWRAVIGLFSPMAPQYNEPEGLGLPTSSVLDQARGINTIRGEWFEVLQEASKKYGTGGEGFAQASVEWLRRHPAGDSIVNPEVFQVGTTHAPGTAAEAGSVDSGPFLTQWMMENKSWIQDNNAVAYYLLPSIHDAQYSAAGMRMQLKNGLREHKDSGEFYRDIRFQIGSREFWDRLDQRSRDLATGKNEKRVYKEFEEWERGWRITNPATSAEMDRRNDPNYIHAELAPALGRLVESGAAPTGVPLSLAAEVWNHYKEYRDKYNETKVGDSGLYDRRKLNSKYRKGGDEKFLGTPVAALWKAIDVYEGS